MYMSAAWLPHGPGTHLLLQVRREDKERWEEVMHIFRPGKRDEQQETHTEHPTV